MSTRGRRRWFAAAVALAALGGCKGPGPEPVPAACTPNPAAGELCPDPEVITPNEAGWWRDDVFYEIFVRSFSDSNADGRGDLRGLTAKLDYLNDANASTQTDLGIDAVWLMPIMASPSYHGYDVTDYRAIESDYGTLEDFDALIAAAHARGIKVILDLVINHTSSSHPWFVSARAGPESPYRDYYIWRDVKPSPTWRQPFGGGADTWHSANGSYYYGLYWGGMPDLNWRNPAVEAEMLDVMRFWLARGADGFRIDAARYLVESEDGKLADQPETHEIIQRLRHALHQDYPDALFVAESWTTNSKVGAYYGEGNEYQLAFNFEIADALIKSVNAGTRQQIGQANYLAETAFPDRGFEAPFLTNHDMARVMRELSRPDTAPNWRKARLAFAMLMAHPGTPFLYYGEEIGMMGGPQTRDEDKRTPMHWDASAPQFGFTTASTNWYGTTAPEAAGTDVETQRADPASLWNLYRDLIALRRGSPALTRGAVERPTVSGGGDGAFAILRTGAAGERVLFVTNLSTVASGAFTVAVAGNPTVLKAEGLTTPPTSESGALSFEGVDPQSFAFIRLD